MPKTWRLAQARAKIVGPMRMLGLALVLPLLGVGHAEARREQTYPFTFTRAWTTAVRLLRIDFASPITEKDKDSGYFLFDFTDGAKQYPGSLELIRILDGGAESVRVVVQIPALPGYVEQNLLDRLGRKLGQEYGTPLGNKSAPSKTETPPEEKAEPVTDGTSPPPKSSAGREQPEKPPPKPTTAKP
jgi:hypothetical protein